MKYHINGRQHFAAQWFYLLGLPTSGPGSKMSATISSAYRTDWYLRPPPLASVLELLPPQVLTANERIPVSHQLNLFSFLL